MFVELPDVGATVSKGGTLGAVESVKSTSDIFSPVSGEVAEVNSELNSSPGLVRSHYCSLYGHQPPTLLCFNIYVRIFIFPLT